MRVTVPACRNREVNDMNCGECCGSGACDVCDGYGCTADSYPNAGDSTECEACTGSGLCQECYGDGASVAPATPICAVAVGNVNDTEKESK
jgi:hypothetical protein